MAKQLKNIKVSHISLVWAGANGASVVYKSAEKGSDIKIIKSDGEKGILYGVVYEPDKVDSQGDFAKAEDIEKAAWDFLKNANQHNVDKDHSFDRVDAFVAESFILKGNDERYPGVKSGAWVVAIKIESDELKKAIKDGEIKGISMAGSAFRVDSNENISDDYLTKILKAVENFFRTKQGQGAEKMDEKTVIEAIDNGMAKHVAPFQESLKKVQEQMAEIKKELADTTKELYTLKEELGKSRQEGGLPLGKLAQQKSVVA